MEEAQDDREQRTNAEAKKAFAEGFDTFQQTSAKTNELVMRVMDSLRVVFQEETRKMMDEHKLVIKRLKWSIMSRSKG